MDEWEQWLRILVVDRGRVLPPEVEQNLRMAGLVKFKRNQPEAWITRKGRKMAKMLDVRPKS